MTTETETLQDPTVLVNPDSPASGTTPNKKRRKRRTKEEMAAARAEKAAKAAQAQAPETSEPPVRPAPTQPKELTQVEKDIAAADKAAQARLAAPEITMDGTHDIPTKAKAKRYAFKDPNE